jgi:hypothetical protein
MVEAIVAKREGAESSQVAPKRKHAGGRPTKYDAKAHPIAAAALAALGLIGPEIADELGIAMSTFSKWQAEHIEFSEAIKAAKVEPDDEVEQSLYKRALGESVKSRTFIAGREVIEYHAADTTACIFWLCNRRPERWKHVNRVEHTGANGGPIDVRHRTLNEIEAEISALDSEYELLCDARPQAASDGAEG